MGPGISVVSVPVALEGPLSVSPLCSSAWSSGASVLSVVLVCKLCVFIHLLALAEALCCPERLVQLSLGCSSMALAFENILKHKHLIFLVSCGMESSFLSFDYSQKVLVLTYLAPRRLAEPKSFPESQALCKSHKAVAELPHTSGKWEGEARPQQTPVALCLCWVGTENASLLLLGSSNAMSLA